MEARHAGHPLERDAMTGTLYGVGVGPGDPELITLAAARLIRDCPVIAYAKADDAPSFARAIVADMLGEQHEEPVVVPMRAERHPAAEVYDEAAARLGQHLAAGRDVCVLCEGDPFHYGSFMYLHARLAGHWPTRVVPGITSVCAAAAATGRPLAARNDVLTTLPATLPDDELERRLDAADAAAIIKLGRHLPRVRALLERNGLAERTAYCERIGLPEQQLAPLDEAPERAPYFSLLLVYRGDEPAIAGRPTVDLSVLGT